MTSVWEEAYGYAGVEFLAKGIPVIANAIGGMVDYVHPGRSGWLNHSLGGGELAEIMLDIVQRPEQIAALNAHLIADRDTYVTPFGDHADDVEAAYAEIVAEHYDRAR
jgi:glycosyltransferase involved in cell wall biosynthesis